jgi:phospholipase C
LLLVGVPLIAAAQLALHSRDDRPLIARASTPIQHIIVFFQENHSFDNVLGALCAANTRATHCDGATRGRISNGQTIPLTQAPDVVPHGCYGPSNQVRSIDGGKMDGFASNCNCPAPSYSCYSVYEPSQIPNLSALATKFAISDRTFELSPVPSWSGHVELVVQTLDGFDGTQPAYNTNQTPKPPAQGPGWGCDSNLDAGWKSSPSATSVPEPACIPDPQLDRTKYPFGGAYRATPVHHVDTIMDRLDAAHLTWKLYSNAWPWAICPSVADCLYTPQRANLVDPSHLFTDAQKGTLPNFSILLPNGGVNGGTSQHNGTSMAVGDNWIGKVMTAVENGPEWSSTAVFITYDDHGGFYDHVPPAFAGAGIRVPMVIVSPYARPGYTDSTPATFASMLAFTEHTYGLPALGTNDASAYDFANAFDYSQTPLRGPSLSSQAISAAEQQYLKAHPANPNDST